MAGDYGWRKMLRQYADKDLSVEEAARLFLSDADDALIHELAYYHALEYIQKIRREHEKGVEQYVFRKPNRPREIVADRDNSQKTKEAEHQRREEVMRRGAEAVAAITTAINFTHEFLKTEFVLNNRGERVTWGEATVVHHEERIRFMRVTERSVSQDIRHHNEIIRLLMQHRAETLNELTEKHPLLVSA